MSWAIQAERQEKFLNKSTVVLIVEAWKALTKMHEIFLVKLKSEKSYKITGLKSLQNITYPLIDLFITF